MTANDSQHHDSPIMLAGLFPSEIASATGQPGFRGRQIFKWLHQKREFRVDAMTDLGKELRREMGERCRTVQLRPLDVVESRKSGTKKILFELADANTVEAVLMRHPRHVTLCLSTQIGCPVGCPFCATGRSRFVRNLTAGEIVEQALHLLYDEGLSGKTPNIVYMGMGEPFLNYEALLRSIRLFMCAEGMGIGARKMTVSTAGEARGIERFAKEKLQVRLSVSLHAANDRLRSELVPLNRKYNLAGLHDALSKYVDTTRRRITIEWILLGGVNDAPGQAAELVRWLGELRDDASVNLIPFNAVDGAGYESPPAGRCKIFLETLTKQGVKATIRRERGGDIEAACGQLRRRR